MKILHINTEKTWRGGEQQTFNLLKGLKERNISSHLICQPGSLMAQKIKKAQIKVFPVAMHGEADLFAGFRIRALINRFNYDILHSHTSHAHSLAFWASFGTKTRRIVTRRVDFSIFRHSFLKLSGIKYRYMADFYIAISNKIKDVLVNDGLPARRIFVARSGINPHRFDDAAKDYLIDEFNIKSSEQVVINVAHLAGHKGQQYLVKAIPLVLSKIPTARFFIIGGGELMDELQTLAISLGLKKKLIFTGFRRDVGAFYHIADLFVMSSVQEGLGTAVLDALALGKPVVAAKSGGIPEIIHDGETGRLVAPADPVALAAGIVELLTHAERAKQMASQGQTVVREKFSIETMVDKNIEIYQQILKPGG
ncbi:MAG: glycosyltransferase family 4 protein [Deltaproteobacteria bacterium]|nr:glycosyltransferase family 4 protein [Deltaproteobacteria bacterium]MBW1847354.1 glycosyltransferase family 4 protein [Deltaproteobacteria bacterium]